LIKPSCCPLAPLPEAWYVFWCMNLFARTASFIINTC
jgi:hypothetical protein